MSYWCWARGIIYLLEDNPGKAIETAEQGGEMGADDAEVQNGIGSFFSLNWTILSLQCYVTKHTDVRDAGLNIRSKCVRLDESLRLTVPVIPFFQKCRAKLKGKERSRASGFS